MLYVALTVK